MNRLFSRFFSPIVVLAMLAGCSNDGAQDSGQGQPAPPTLTGNVALLAANGLYVASDLSLVDDASGTLVASRTSVGTWETFTVVNLDSGRFALKAFNGKFVCADLDKGGNLIANRDEPGGWETFELVVVDSTRIALRTFGNTYVSVDTTQGASYGIVSTGKETVNELETFTVVRDPIAPVAQ